MCRRPMVWQVCGVVKLSLAAFVLVEGALHGGIIFYEHAEVEEPLAAEVAAVAAVDSRRDDRIDPADRRHGLPRQETG